MDHKLFLITLLYCGVSAHWPCTTYPGSKCVPLDECEILRSLLMQPNRDKTAFEILNEYNCGYIGRDPKVCCPAKFDMFNVVIGKDCITADGDVGTCTKLEDCDHIKEQIENSDFITQENMEFFKRSKCTPSGSSDSLNVCCKSQTSPSPLPVPDNRFQNKCVLTAFPPEPGSNCCGVESSSDPRIIGGKETAIDQFPWLVIIDYTREGYSCGGSLISGKYVLTAAHCLVGPKGKDRQAVSVRVGEYNITNSGPDCVETSGGGIDCTYGEIAIPIESYVVHEGYNADHVLKYHDIALIRLNDTVNYTDFIRPICLPSKDFTISAPDPLNLYISGWGIYDSSMQSSDIKLFAVVPYVKKEQCNKRYSKLGREPLADYQLCVGGEANKDSCRGDSGGPLMNIDNLTYEAAGVISFGTTTCGLENWPSIYVKVYDYLDWIRENIKP